jgi:signal peptidase I
MSVDPSPPLPVHAAIDLACQAIAAGAEVPWRVVGASMQPLLRPGDVVIVQAAALHDLRRGDLVLIRRPTDVVTHRLVGRDALGWRARGDNLLWFDPPFPDEAIVGRITAREREGVRISLDSLPFRLFGISQAWAAWLLVPLLALFTRRTA